MTAAEMVADVGRARMLLRVVAERADDVTVDSYWQDQLRAMLHRVGSDLTGIELILGNANDATSLEAL